MSTKEMFYNAVDWEKELKKCQKELRLTKDELHESKKKLRKERDRVDHHLEIQVRKL